MLLIEIDAAGVTYRACLGGAYVAHGLVYQVVDGSFGVTSEGDYELILRPVAGGEVLDVAGASRARVYRTHEAALAGTTPEPILWWEGPVQLVVTSDVDVRIVVAGAPK